MIGGNFIRSQVEISMNWLYLDSSFAFFYNHDWRTILNQASAGILYSNFGAKLDIILTKAPEKVYLHFPSFSSEGTFLVMDVSVHGALTGVRYDFLQIYQFSIAKIMTFFLRDQCQCSVGSPCGRGGSPRARETHWSCMWRLCMEPYKLIWSLECSPGASHAHPGAMETHPGHVEVCLGAVEAHPGVLEAHPGSLKTHWSFRGSPWRIVDSPCGLGGSFWGHGV